MNIFLTTQTHYYTFESFGLELEAVLVDRRHVAGLENKKELQLIMRIQGSGVQITNHRSC